MFNKITHGYVVQRFNDQGECLGQEFVADCNFDEFEEENDDGNCVIIDPESMPFGGNEYFPFNMVQPN